MLFDPEELADMRADFTGLMVDACQVLRNVPTRDSGGDTLDAWTPHGRATVCRTWNAQSPSDLQSVVTAARIGGAAVWRVLVPFGTDVRAGDRLSVTPVGGRVTTFQVAGDDAGASDALGILCICSQVD